ncbi:MAG: hypothetical protein P8O13_03145 [Porticoccaceae bacterium]|nr:hypothetical protein [Porticoccaceae bacterium]
MAAVIKVWGFGLLLICVNPWAADGDLYHRYWVPAAAVQPLSSHSNGNNHNQTYIGIFSPDSNVPVSSDNLKLYRIEFDENTLKPILDDADGLPVPVMRLGYNAETEDLNPKSEGIVIINELSGEIIWQFSGFDVDTDFSVTANVTVIDRNSDGFADRIYFVDMHGQLWRMNSQSSESSVWTANRLLTLPSGSKFVHAPDVIASADNSYDGVILGSGDIDKPFDTRGQNYLVFYRDRGVSQSFEGTLIGSLDDLYEVKFDSGSPVLDVTNVNDIKFSNGWYLKLGKGEKIVSRALTANNITVFATHTHCAPVGCQGLGEVRIYRIEPFAVAAGSDYGMDYTVVGGQGILPSPLNFTVTVSAESCEGEKCAQQSKIVREALLGPHVEQFGNQGLGVRRKLWWYIVQDD